MVRKEEKALILCGIPYIFGTLGSSDKNFMRDASLTNLGVEVVIDKMTELFPQEHACAFASGEKFRSRWLVSMSNL
ncbi:MAG: hypothetical protein GX817_06230 [Elusimicrobia bacterium]|nr:hypothetical protein [Elusimicrobiota bacterium]